MKIFFQWLFGSKKKGSNATTTTAVKEAPAPVKKDPADEKWWLHEQPERPELPALEGLDCEKVMEALRRDVEEGKLEIIAIPANIMQILDFLEKEEWSYAELSSQLEHSPGMAGDFLSVANSAAFCRGVKAKDLRNALPRLGKDTIKAILFINIGKMFVPEDPLFQEISKGIIDHSMAVARVSSLLSTRFKLDPNFAFLAGLLHSIGKLALLKHFAMHYDVPANLKPPFHESLFSPIFDQVYEEAGRVVCEQWGLEKDIQLAISHHRFFRPLAKGEETKRYLHLAALINLSDIMVRIQGKGMPHPPCDIFDTVSARVVGLKHYGDTKLFLAKVPDLVHNH